jgi:hypothetical protein
VLNVTSDNIPHFENNFTHVELDYFTHVESNWMMWQEGTKWLGEEMTRGQNDRVQNDQGTKWPGQTDRERNERGRIVGLPYYYIRNNCLLKCIVYLAHFLVYFCPRRRGPMTAACAWWSSLGFSDWTVWATEQTRCSTWLSCDFRNMWANEFFLLITQPRKYGFFFADF